jgi:hypothetical protein
MSSKQITGTRAQVMHGTANKTSGGLTKSQLKYNKQGKIVSRKASALATKNNRLVKAGYVTTKGVFGIVKTRGGNRFELGNKPQQKYINMVKKGDNPDLKLPITPIPEEIVDSPEFNEILKNDVKTCHTKCKYKYRVSHEGVVKVFRSIWDQYLRQYTMPSDLKLNEMSTRKIIMYLGKNNYTFNLLLDSLKGEIFEQNNNSNIQRYKNLVRKNYSTSEEVYGMKILRGMKITTKNFKEQTLWRLAIHYTTMNK